MSLITDSTGTSWYKYTGGLIRFSAPGLNTEFFNRMMTLRMSDGDEDEFSAFSTVAIEMEREGKAIWKRLIGPTPTSFARSLFQTHASLDPASVGVGDVASGSRMISVGPPLAAGSIPLGNTLAAIQAQQDEDLAFRIGQEQMDAANLTAGVGPGVGAGAGVGMLGEMSASDHARRRPGARPRFAIPGGPHAFTLSSVPMSTQESLNISGAVGKYELKANTYGGFERAIRAIVSGTAEEVPGAHAVRVVFETRGRGLDGLPSISSIPLIAAQNLGELRKFVKNLVDKMNSNSHYGEFFREMAEELGYVPEEIEQMIHITEAALVATSRVLVYLIPNRPALFNPVRRAPGVRTATATATVSASASASVPAPTPATSSSANMPFLQQFWDASHADPGYWGLDDEFGGCNKSAKKNHTERARIPSKFIHLQGYNPASAGNNCGLDCLRKINANLPSCAALRKLLGVPANEKLTRDQLQYICKVFNMPELKVFTQNSLEADIEKALSDGCNCLLLQDGHYIILSTNDREKQKCKDCGAVYKNKHKCDNDDRKSYYKNFVKNGGSVKGYVKAKKELDASRIPAFFDLETRLEDERCQYVPMSDDGGLNPILDRVVFRQVATLCSLYFVDSNGQEVTKSWLGLDCLERFIDYLHDLDEQKIYLNLMAHNGSRFDALLLLGAVKAHPRFSNATLAPECIFKGTRLLKMPVFSHVVRDTFCFLASSLSKLCDDFGLTKPQEDGSPPKIVKQKHAVVNGVRWRTMDICLLNPRWSPAEFLAFLELEEGKPYKDAYIEYCEFDCKSLALVWEAFSKTFDEITKDIVGERPSPLMSAATLPGASMKLFKIVNAKTDVDDGYWSPKPVASTQKLAGEVYDVPLAEQKKRSEIYNMLNEAIVGGISHVALPGRHFASEGDESIALVDVVSLYVWAMLTQQYPKGEPRIVYDVNECLSAVFQGKLGVFAVENVVMREGATISSFPGNVKGKRDWMASHINATVMTNIDIKRIIGVPGQSVKILKGLIWDQTYNPFVNVLSNITNMKKLQDVYKNSNDPRYNACIREVCKLLGNSLFGKMMERGVNSDWAEYSSLDEFIGMLGKDEDVCETVRVCNKRVYVQRPSEAKQLAPIQFGVFILAYSRDLMQDYFDIIGRDHVIASETDSIYCRKSALKHLMASTHPLYRIGKELGNMDLEMDNITDSYFLGKKCYAIKYSKFDKAKKCQVEDYKMRLKGVPSKFLRIEAYEALYRDCQVSFPMINPETGAPFEIRDKDGFIEDPNMILWSRVAYNGHSSGVTMKMLSKNVKSMLGLKSYDYSLIGSSCLRDRQEKPNNPRKFMANVRPRFMTEEEYYAKRPKPNSLAQVSIPEQMHKNRNHAEIQDAFLALIPPASRN
jgi:hypothetical protein